MKQNSTSKIRKIILAFSLVTGIIMVASITKQAHSKAKLEVSEDGDDDEPLSSSCGGTERWSEKVFTDADAGSIDFAHPHPTSILNLATLPTVTPTSGNPRIQPQEDSVYTVTVKITEYRPESDSDCHLVITDASGRTMVAEVPDPGCSSVAASPKVAEFITCRDWVIKNLGTTINTSVNLPQVVITGVSFYDPPHGQAGAAPNNMELHSVIDIHFANVGINEIAGSNEKINVFPNPSSGVFNVNSIPLKSKIVVYNLMGDVIYTSDLKRGTDQVDLTGRAAGIYLYKILNENGNFTAAGRMLIK